MLQRLLLFLWPLALVPSLVLAQSLSPNGVKIPSCKLVKNGSFYFLPVPFWPYALYLLSV